MTIKADWGTDDVGSAMTDDRRQRLSALVDGECSPAELKATLAEALLDPELKACWERYQNIGRALRGEPVRPAARAVAGRVAERLAAEPPALPVAPRSTVTTSRRLAAAAGPILGVALAAGIAMVAVVLGPSLGTHQTTSTAPNLAATMPDTDAAGQDREPADRWAVDEPRVASKLNELLVSHRERSPATGFGGLIPYAAVVSYGGSR